MVDALSMSELGMLQDVERMRVIANNLANLSTVGFKMEIPVTRPFSDVIDQHGGAQTAGANAVPRPTFTSVVNHAAGTLKFTGNPLDLAVEGDGFFVVHGEQGDVLTRQGNFHVDDLGRVVSATGQRLQGVSGEIRLTMADPRIAENGEIQEGAISVGQIKVVRVMNPESLVRVGGGAFVASESTQWNEVDQNRIRQGYIEVGNVVPMYEMVQMIETVRHFEAEQRIALGYDQMMDVAINVLGETNK